MVTQMLATRVPIALASQWLSQARTSTTRVGAPPTGVATVAAGVTHVTRAACRAAQTAPARKRILS
jgi:hypothetical protein